jgi:hypothetical protein
MTHNLNPTLGLQLFFGNQNYQSKMYRVNITVKIAQYGCKYVRSIREGFGSVIINKNYRTRDKKRKQCTRVKDTKALKIH